MSSSFCFTEQCYKKNADNQDNFGGDVDISNVGLEDCSSKCTAREDCVGFVHCPGCTWLPFMSTCYLKGTLVPLTYNIISMNFYQKGKIIN